MKEDAKDQGIVAALTALVERLERLEAKATPEGRISADELQQRIVAEIRGKDRPLPPSEILKGCRSELTGGVFDAWIENGLVKELRNYVHAPGYDKHEAEGGRVPNGMPIDPEDKFGYAKWLSDEWRRDLAMFVGKPPMSFMKRAA